MLSLGNSKFKIVTALLITLQVLVCDTSASTGDTPHNKFHNAGEYPKESVISDNNSAENKPFKEMFVTGFSIKGNGPWQKKTVGDLEIMVTNSDKRYLPLYRLLKVFEIDRTAEGNTVKFLPEGMPYVALDILNRSITVDKSSKTIALIEAKSEVTGENDVFVAPEIVSEIFGIELIWHEANYEFVARSARKLKIWKTTLRSAHEIQLQDVPTNLPEAHPQATPNRFSLDFMELTARSNFISDNNFKEKQVSLDNLQQIFWGSFLGGAYKFNLFEREFYFGNKDHRQGADSLFMLYRGEWNKRYRSTEVSLGDSFFGLSDLTFPSVRITGVRVNGLTGFSGEENTRDSSRLGMRNYFVQPQVFEGSAPRGSQVELKINGRIINTQEAVPDVGSEAGTGNYSFEDVILPPGSLNEILITITDTNGFKTYLKKELLGSSLFLPQGKIAFLGSAGTRRDVRTWQTRGIFAGGRALYAFSKHFTVGYTLAFQHDLFDRTASYLLNSQQRNFPDSSLHMGGQFIWQPSYHLILSGDAAFSHGTYGPDPASSDDTAFKVNASLFPTSTSSILGEYFRYGPDFFNGQNIELRDRQGYFLRGKWRFYPDWSMTGLYANTSNNLTRTEPKTLDLDFRKLEITSSAIPRTTVGFSANRSAPSWESPDTLYILKLYAMVTPDVTVSGAVATGDSLYLTDHSDFANGINIAGLAAEEPSSFVSLGVIANERNDLAATYAKRSNQEKVWCSHRYRSSGNSFRTKTEVGYDLTSRSPIVKNRTEYLLDDFRNKSLEFIANYENKNLFTVISLNFRGLFGFHDGFPSPIQSRYIQPDNGGITGKVFVDYDADSEMDPNEAGLENVKVVMGGNSCLTDKNGYFNLPNTSEITDAKVFIDMSTVPAIYSPTHGLQKAHVVPGILTEVNLGVTPLISVSGLVTAETEEHKIMPLYGVRVFITKPDDSKVLAESSTAGDGSYYLGDLRPGKYLLQVDKAFLQQNIAVDSFSHGVATAPASCVQEIKIPLPNNMVVEGLSQTIEIAPAVEPQEIQIPSFKFFYRKNLPKPGGGVNAIRTS